MFLGAIEGAGAPSVPYRLALAGRNDLCGSGSCLTFQFRLLLYGSRTRFRWVRDNSSGRCFTPWFVATGRGGFFRGRGWTAEGAGMLRELRVSEMRYRAVLEVLDGR